MNAVTIRADATFLCLRQAAAKVKAITAAVAFMQSVIFSIFPPRETVIQIEISTKWKECEGFDLVSYISLKWISSGITKLALIVQWCPQWSQRGPGSDWLESSFVPPALRRSPLSVF
jgi:hypothetical protein